MKYLESAFTGKNSWWRYIFMIFAIIAGTNTIGSIPIIVPLIKRMIEDPAAANILKENPSNFSALGIDPNYGLFMMLFPFLAGLLVFALLFKPVHERKFSTTISGLRKIRWNRFLISFILWTLISSIYLFVYMKIEPGNFILNNSSISILYISVIALMLIPFQAGFEEFIFRGYLMQGFAVAIRNRWAPLILTSLFFGILHSFNPEVKEYGFFTMMPQYIAFGVIFGIVTIMDDGIEAAIGAHAANNIFLVIMLTHKSSSLQTPSLYMQKIIYPWIEFAGLLVMGIIFILVMKAIFKWDDFGKLFGKVIPDTAPEMQKVSEIKN
jgi:membrane protease YdiL (CAAX protease family)